jgi:2',3'-cyclic-nucleotide 2'-phosphodiesterase (5'-nucleotidase family)
LLGGAAASLATPGWLRGAQDLPSDLVRISILHTTDLHGHILPTLDYNGRADLGGMARCVTQIRRWRKENPNSLLIDVGDVYQGTEFALRDQGRMMIELFNLLRYDAWIVGNHEFDWGIEPFRQAVARSAMPVLAANTRLDGKAAGDFDHARQIFAKIQPFVLKEVAGIKIAVIGLTTPGMPFWFPPKFIEGIEFHFKALHDLTDLERDVVADAKRLKRLRSAMHDRPIGLAAHDDGDGLGGHEKLLVNGPMRPENEGADYR